jgi:hypothetical protein
MGFEQASQPAVVRHLMESAADRLIVVALRDPYELRHFADVPAYVCAFSFPPVRGRGRGRSPSRRDPRDGPLSRHGARNGHRRTRVIGLRRSD